MPERSRTPWLILVLLVTLGVYFPSLFNGYAMDDRMIAMGILENGKKHPMIYDLKPIRSYFNEHYWQGHVASDDLYRPVTVWSYALVHHLFKPAEPDFLDEDQKETALPQHLVNVVLHLLACVLVFGLLRCILVPPAAAVFGTLVFGLHAIHSEVVSTVVGRAELFCFVFGAAAVLLLFVAWKRNLFLKVLACPPSAFLFFLAFCSKENSLAWIGFLAVYGLALAWRRSPGGQDGENSLKPALKQFAVHAVVAAIPLAVFLWFRWRVIHDNAAVPVNYIVNPLDHVPWFHRFLTAVFIWGWKGLGLTLFPFSLTCDYGSVTFPILTTVLDPRFLLMALVLLGVLLTGLVGAARRPLLFLAVCVFFGFSFIISNVPLAIGTIFGERLYYAPSLAVAFLIAWLFEKTRGHASLRPALSAVTFLWLGASILVICQRNPVWNDDSSLFPTAVERQPRSTRMQICAAGVHTDRGEDGAAVNHLREALRLDPEYALAWNNLGASFLNSGRLDEAEECIREGLRAGHIDRKEDGYKLHCNMGLILKQMGRLDESFSHLEKALFLNPSFERTWKEILALTRETTAGNPAGFDRLLAVVKKGNEQAGDSPYWPYYRGRVMVELGRAQDAIAAFQASLLLDPAFEKARIALLERVYQTFPPERLFRLIKDGEAHDPEFPHWAYYRGLTLAREKQMDAAREAFVDSLDVDGNFRAAWEDFLAVTGRAEDLEKAEAVLKEAEEKRPFSPHWPYFRGILLGKQGKVEEAMEAMGRSLRNKPGFFAAWNELLALARGGPGFKKILEIVNRSMEADRNRSPQWPYYRGIALNVLGVANQAVHAFEEAIRRDSAFLEARLELLQLVHRAYKPEAVFDIIRGGLVTHSKNPAWPLYRGLTYHHMGNHSLAAPLLAKALRGMPGHAEGRFALAGSVAHLGNRQEAAKIFQGIAGDEKVPLPLRQKARQALKGLGGK